MLTGAVAATLRGMARLYPWSVEPSDDLAGALGFVGARVAPETVVRAGYGAGMAVTAVGALALSLLAPASLLPAVGGLVAAALGATHLVHATPKLLATARRTNALGEAPGVVSRLVLRMRLTPTTEAAASFAARTGEGPLAASLREHVRRADGTPESGLGGFATEWRDRFPSLARAILLVGSAGDAPAAQRERTLDRAQTAVLDGTRERMAEFAGAIRGPATALYAFGVLLPLALAALLPAAAVAGVSASLPTFVALYDVVLPAGLVGASAWLLARRPVAFPPPTVPSDHPDLPDRRWPALPVGGLAGAAGWVVATRFLPWSGTVVAVGLGAGTTLFVWYRPVMAVRERVREVESGLADALYLIGRRVEEGWAVEAAIERAAEEATGETGVVLGDAARRGRQLRVGVAESFLGEHGALSAIPSVRARSVARLLSLAAREGTPAGSTVVSMADHLDELEAVEREAVREIRRVTATLGTTGAAFGPLVAGATVALADRMARGTLAGDGTPATGELGLAVGGYVLVLAAVLSALGVGLSRGLDRAAIGYRVGGALVTATLVYVGSVLAVGTLL